jgi:hypothetical protein
VLRLHLVQVVATEAPTAKEYVPTPQSTQAPCAVAPVVVRYLPAPHSTHEVEPGASIKCAPDPKIHVKTDVLEGLPAVVVERAYSHPVPQGPARRCLHQPYTLV